MKTIFRLMLGFSVLMVMFTINNCATTKLNGSVISSLATSGRGNYATDFERQSITTKTTICESPEGKAGVRFTKHYGEDLVFNNIILCNYDAATYYVLEKKFSRAIPINRSEYTVVQFWYND